jgi:hypothetical protein
MAGAIVQSAYVVDDAGGDTVIAATLAGVVAGNTLVTFVGFEDLPTTVSSVSDGASYTSAGSKVADAGNGQASQVFYKENASSGSHTATATFSALIANRRIRYFELSGLATSSSLDQATGQSQATPGTGANAVSSGASSATTNANDFVMGFSQDTTQVNPGTGTVTAGTGYTISGSNIILSAESKNVSSTGAQTATFTQSVNNSRTTHVIAFKQVAAGGASAKLLSMLNNQGGF